MIPKYEIEKVLEATNIVDVITAHYPDLSKKGSNYTACCPFHQEKTPSFSVSPSKGIYKCFGCGKSGNAISFLMEFCQMSYVEAIRDLANRANIAIAEYDNLTEEDKTRYEKSERMILAYKFAAEYYHKNLFNQANKEVLDYALSRMNEEAIHINEIGYADGGLKAFLNNEGFTNDLLVEAGLLSKNDKAYKDIFWKRLMFPIRNSTGEVIAFTGRTMVDDKKIAKYSNSKTTPIYKKDEILFNFSFAKKTAYFKKSIFLVEGNMDAITLNSIGVENVVATSGTALSHKQIQIVERVCKNIKIIADTDNPGIEAMHKSAKLFIEHGFEVEIVSLPKTGEKIDADSFFKGKTIEDFNNYVSDNTLDYIDLLVNEQQETIENKSKAQQAKIHKEIISLIANYPPERSSLYLEDLKANWKKVKWNDLYSSEKKSKEKAIEDKRRKEAQEHNENNAKTITSADDNTMEIRELFMQSVPSAKRDFFLKYGFYDNKNKLYFLTSKNKTTLHYLQSNFIIEPIALILSTNNPRRLMKIINEHGRELAMEFKIESLISVSAFKKEVEGKGNFIFEGTDSFLDKLKGYLYEQSVEAKEITQLGWQRNKDFWAFANGVIVNGQFKKYDDYGIVDVMGNHYFHGSFSSIYKEDERFNTEQRKIVYTEREKKLTYKEFVDAFAHFYKDNGKIISLLLFGIIFRDIIRNKEYKLPIIYCFGMKNSGKTTFAKQFMGLFMQNVSELNVFTTTLPALATRMDGLSNMPILLDEFKNTIAENKIEFLKSCYDSTGRVKTNMDDITKTTTARADGAIIMCSQQQIQEPALLNRCCVLNFFNTHYPPSEMAKNKALSFLMSEGHTYIIAEFLKYRDIFEEKFIECYSQASSDIGEKVRNIDVRILECWTYPVAIYKIMSPYIDFGFSEEDILEICINKASEQSIVNIGSSELTLFWKSVVTSISTLDIRNNYDFIVALEDKISLDNMKEPLDFDEEKEILYLNTAKVFQCYEKYEKNSLPKRTIITYLTNSSAFLGEKKSKRFLLDNKEGNTYTKSSIVTRAMVFDYKTLKEEFDIDFKTTSEMDEINNSINEKSIVIENDLFNEKDKDNNAF